MRATMVSLEFTLLIFTLSPLMTRPVDEVT